MFWVVGETEVLRFDMMRGGKRMMCFARAGRAPNEGTYVDLVGSRTDMRDEMR